MAARGQGCQWGQIVHRKASQEEFWERGRKRGTRLQLGHPAPQAQEDTPLTLSPDVVGLSYPQIGRRSPPEPGWGTQLSLPPAPCRAGSTCQQTHPRPAPMFYFISSSSSGNRSKLEAANWSQKSRAVTSSPACGSQESYLNPSRPSPRSWRGWRIFQKPK